MQFRATSSRESGRGGITLVELLVVIAIIGLLASVSVPFAMRMGLVPSRKVDAGARDLFQMLRAARIYATTHNVDTAVAYSIAAPADSVSGIPAPVLDAVALVRRLKASELDAPVLDAEGGESTLRAQIQQDLSARGESISDITRLFVPVGSPEGVFRLLSNNTCVLTATLLDPTSGLSRIQVYDIGNLGLLVFQRQLFGEGGPGEQLPPDIVERFRLRRFFPTHFPAHVFRPSGALVSDSPKQRVVLSIGLLPDADPGDRFNLDQNGNPAGEISAQVELYTAQGRVKIVS